MNIETRSFLVAESKLRAALVEHGRPVKTETWQGRDVSHRPDMETFELLNVTLTVALRGILSLEHWRRECRPNLPWADDHFLERVSGEPINPPPSWEWWPWAKSAGGFRKDHLFNHTYPERYWPKLAGLNHGGAPHTGIRGSYGDLSDVIRLLKSSPHTRQAYLPIFFPEDTGVGDGGRKPCSLGYQFIRREDQLHCFYPMRSCDLVRHWADDVYLTVRLMLWILEQCEWPEVFPGTLTMHMTSLHVFVNDFRRLQAELEPVLQGAIAGGTRPEAASPSKPSGGWLLLPQRGAGAFLPAVLDLP